MAGAGGKRFEKHCINAKHRNGQLSQGRNVGILTFWLELDSAQEMSDATDKTLRKHEEQGQS